jgi:hypothetical protein
MAGKTQTLVACVSLVFTSACHERNEPTIQLVTGMGNEQQLSLSPKSSFAEYVELPTQGDQLSIVLTDFTSSCDEYTSTPANGVMITLTFILPVGQRPLAGTYPWPGLPSNVNSLAELDLKAPIVIPVVKHGPKSMTLLPGGSVDLQRLSLERQGEVAGVMRLEQSGGDGQPATRLFGSFVARVCRTTNQAGGLGQ